MFVDCRYVNKRWASTTSPQPKPEIPIEKSVSIIRKEIPKKARKYSLDEYSFNEGAPHIAHPTKHSRAVFFPLSLTRVTAKLLVPTTALSTD